jgi:hypothetical protein
MTLGPEKCKVAAVVVMRSLSSGNTANRVALTAAIVEVMGGGSDEVSDESAADAAAMLMESLCCK